MKTSTFAKKALAVLLAVMMVMSGVMATGVFAAGDHRDDGQISVDDITGDDKVVVTVTLDFGDDDTQTVSGYAGDPMVLPEPEDIAEYEFGGWQTEGGEDAPATFPEEDVTYVVNWIKCQYVAVETVTATCKEPGEMTYTCSSCGDSYTEAIPALGHNYVVDYEDPDTKPETCTEPGFGVYVCVN